MKTEKKRNKYIIIVIILLLLLIFIVAGVFLFSKEPSEPDVTISSSEASSEVQSVETSTPSVESETEESSKPVSSTSKNNSKTDKVESSSKEEVSSEPKPVEKSDANKILESALSKLKKLKGDSKEVNEVSSPVKLSISVKDTISVEDAANEILEKIKSKLNYNEATANGNVAIGNPNPFSYDYDLIYIQNENGKHIFTFEYRYRQYYNVADKGYDTNGFVEEIIKHLTAQGKVKFDYQTTSNISETQPVIILLEDDYEVALEKAKGHVDSVCSSYRNFDFAYKALTVAGRGDTEKTALMFYIYCK